MRWRTRPPEAIALKACPQRGGTTNASACLRQAIAKNTGLCDYFAPLSLRS
ncbi:hypothetical protein [Nostoc sp.]|uniref:hypothetical protein n=1 Tax=Nostoc sp. TaxID=1180 RepID=UPI002FFB52E9